MNDRDRYIILLYDTFPSSAGAHIIRVGTHDIITIIIIRIIIIYCTMVIPYVPILVLLLLHCAFSWCIRYHLNFKECSGRGRGVVKTTAADKVQ